MYKKFVDFIFWYSIIIFIWGITSSFLIHQILGDSDPQRINSISLDIQFLFIIIIAPFVETLIFQTSIFFICNKIFKLNNVDIVVITISTLLFGLAHYYNFYIMIKSFVSGFFFAHLYSRIIKDYKITVATIVVFMTHLFANLYGFILNRI